MNASLLVIQGVDQGTRFEIESDRVRLGRGAQSDIRILDTEVSRRHATIVRRPDGFILEDDNSSNGSFVNGEPVRICVLENGDQLQIGRTILLFVTEGQDSRTSQIADRVSLLDLGVGDDHSQIIGSLDSAAGIELARQATAGMPPDRADASLQALYRISEEVTRPSASIDELLQRIMNLTLETVSADRGCMLVADSRTDRIEPRVISHRGGVDLGERMPLSSSIVQYVIQQGQAVRTSDAQHDLRFQPGQSIVAAGIREAMCVPIQGRYELLGLIYVDTTSQAQNLVVDQSHEHRFTDDMLKLLLAVGRQAALAVENNRFQQALLTAERLAAVGQTIAILSHHIKNILQGVRGGSYFVDAGLQKKDLALVHKGWGIVERNQTRIYNLVMDMLTFSKERRPELRPADLNEVVGEVCELMQARSEELGVAFECKQAAGLPVCVFDAEGIHRAVLNILTNALEVLDNTEQGRVTIETGFDAREDRLFVEVADNGPGIPEEELPRLFSLFESTKGAHGTGLGLAVSQKILKEHGGEITVESRPGCGAKFRLSWPLMTDEPSSPDSAEYDVLP